MKKNEKSASKITQYAREIAFAVLDLLLIFLLMLLLRGISKVSEEISQLENSKNEAESVYVLKSTSGRIAENKNIIDKINSYFVDDSNIVSFVKEIDILRTEGTVTQFSFVSDEPIIDSVTSFNVLPFEIVFQGDKTGVENALKKILELPYLIRCVVTEIDRGILDGIVTIKFGGFLYVNENFGKNR